LLPVLALSSAVSGAVIERQASGSSLELPQKPTIYKLSPSDFNKTADEAIEKELAIVAEIAAIAYDDATFNNTIQAYADFSSEKKIILSSLQPYMAMGPTAELRQAANEALIRVADVELTVSLNEAFFALVEKIHKQFEQEGKLDTPEGILTLGLWSGFLSNGINLPAGPQRDRLTDITQEINDLQFQFEGNVQADNTTLWFTKDELDGLGEAELDALPPGEGENSGKFGILLVSTQETGLIKGYVKNENTRRIADYERQRIVPQNVDILKKAVGLRDEFARIQNYSNYASFIIDNSTFQAQSAQEVNDLLKDLQTRLAPVAEKELEEITAVKKEYNASATTAYDWDAGYYSSLILRQKYNLSNGEKDQWFPAENTVMEVLNIYSDVYGFDFMRVQGDDLSRLSPTGNAGDLFWEEDVRLYTVWDEPVDGKDPEFAGYMYLDLYRREGKSAGAYMMPLEPGYIIPGGDRHYPVVALATNFKRAGEDSDTPSLLTGSDLVNILHELGHGMHHLSCRVRFGDQCGILGSPLDFSEMPSQMMEVSLNHILSGSIPPLTSTSF
jgi:metallopeptidase MepB